MAEVKTVGFNPSRTKRELFTPDVQLFFSNEVLRAADRYVPMDTGALAGDVTIEQNSITYNVPYAHRMFTGTGFNFSAEKHPLAQAQWHRPVIEMHLTEIGRAIAKYMQRKI